MEDATIIDISESESESSSEFTFNIRGNELTCSQIRHYFIYNPSNGRFDYDQGDISFFYDELPWTVRETIMNHHGYNAFGQKLYGDCVIEMNTEEPKPDFSFEIVYSRLWISYMSTFKPIPEYDGERHALLHFIYCLLVSLLNVLSFLFITPFAIFGFVFMTIFALVIFGIIEPTVCAIAFLRKLQYRTYYRRLGHCIIDYLEYYISRIVNNPWMCAAFMIGLILSWIYNVMWLFQGIAQFIEFSSLMKTSWESHTGKEEHPFFWEKDNSLLHTTQPYDNVPVIYAYWSDAESSASEIVSRSTSSSDEE